jgi:outer membrane lipoprotein-sorting protein
VSGGFGRPLALLMPVLLLPVVCSATTAAPDVVARLRELGRASATVSTLRAHFAQEKHVTIVRDVLRSSGTFWLDKRGRIAWQVVEPDPVRIVIRRDGVFVAGKRVGADSAERGGESAVNANLSPLPMLEGLNGIFAGVSEETARDFEVTFRDRDRLQLVPRSRSLSAWLSAIEITLGGEAQTPQRVRLEEPGGDVTEITFSDVTVNPPLDDAAFAP